MGSENVKRGSFLGEFSTTFKYGSAPGPYFEHVHKVCGIKSV